MAKVSKAVHVYQMTEGRVLIFYTLSDFLVFYTIFSVYARRYGVRILGLALMYNHIHVLIAAESKKEVEKFVSRYTSQFVTEYNKDSGRKGPLFHKGFGAAVKTGEKNIRTAAGYLYNNHTNKKLCDKAEQVRWNFLAYAHNDFPFSSPYVSSKASYRVKQAVKLVRVLFGEGKYLDYASIARMFRGLEKEEKEQLTDFIISTYKVVDYEALEGLYRSPEEMIYSFNANTFNEYEIDEDVTERRGDDRIYIALSKYVQSSGKFERLKDILTLSREEKMVLASELHENCRATYRQIGTFLQLPMSRAQSSVTEEYVNEAYQLIEEGRSFLEQSL